MRRRELMVVRRLPGHFLGPLAVGTGTEYVLRGRPLRLESELDREERRMGQGEEGNSGTRLSSPLSSRRRTGWDEERVEWTLKRYRSFFLPFSLFKGGMRPISGRMEKWRNSCGISRRRN